MDISPEDAIVKYGFPMITPEMSEEEFKKSPYVLIRHGLSIFNYNIKQTDVEFGEGSAESRAVETNKELFDPELHPIGIKQCENHQEQINKIKWKVVFSSPMQRAMMTTIHMFKNHPDKANIKFVVLPIAREVLHTTNDIAMDCHEMIEKYSEGKPEACGLKFDFSRLFLYGIPQLW
jgi:broad specificity phosphatase PhoE